jgi:hypothetical protein
MGDRSMRKRIGFKIKSLADQFSLEVDSRGMDIKVIFREREGKENIRGQKLFRRPE